MTARWRWAIVGSGLGLCLVGMGFLREVLAERGRFDQPRSVVMTWFGQISKKWGDSVITPGRTIQAGRDSSEAPWTPHIEKLNEALAKKNLSAATMAWRDAYGVALGSRQWEGMIAVGDAALRMGDVGGSRQAPEPTARDSYLTALFRARRQGSLDGVLRTAEAFAALGDPVGVVQAMSIAEELATRDPEWPARVRAFAEQLAARMATAKTSNVNPR